MKTRLLVCCAALVALAAAIAITAGCVQGAVFPVPIGTDIFFVGVNSSVEEITVAPNSRIELGVYRQIWDEAAGVMRTELVTLSTAVVYVTAAPGIDRQPTDLAVVHGGTLLVGAVEGVFLVWADDASQNIQNAKPLTVKIEGAAPVTPTGGQVTINVSVTSPVRSGVAYVITIPSGVVIDWGQIPAGGISVIWVNNPNVTVGTITVVNGIPQIVFIAGGLSQIAATIPLGTVAPITLNFTIGGTTYTLTIYVQGTQTVTPPPTPSPIVITLPDGTVVTDGMTVVIDTNGSMFLVQGGGPYSVTTLVGPFTVQVIDGAFLVTPISGTAPGTYSVIIRITDAHGQVRVIHITLVIEGSVAPPVAATGVTVSPAGPLTLQTGATQQFVGSVQPSGANQAVYWSCTRGTITTNGFYVAPATGCTDEQVVCGSKADSSVYRLVDIVVVDPTGGVNVVIEGSN